MVRARQLNHCCEMPGGRRSAKVRACFSGFAHVWNTEGHTISDFLYFAKLHNFFAILVKIVQF